MRLASCLTKDQIPYIPLEISHTKPTETLHNDYGKDQSYNNPLGLFSIIKNN